MLLSCYECDVVTQFKLQGQTEQKLLIFKNIENDNKYSYLKA